MNAKPFTSIGGQAIIEGVMMRSPHFLAFAVRLPNNQILIKSRRARELGSWLKQPFLRGVATLVDSMIYGVQALSFSADVAVEAEEKAKEEKTSSDGSRDAIQPSSRGLSNFAIFSSIALAFVMGILLFVAAPHYLAYFLGEAGLFSSGVLSPWFHVVDGVIKVIFLVVYVFFISLMDDIRRVFQYHGAEHKSIYAFESGRPLTVNEAAQFSTLHPRCGTSFLLFLLMISVLVFSILLPPFQAWITWESNGLRQAFFVLIKILLMFPVAALSYEFIRFSANHMQSLACRLLISPGLALQRLTTREPDPNQLEVALCSLKRVLDLEKNPPSDAWTEDLVTLSGPNEIVSVAATASEFPG